MGDFADLERLYDEIRIMYNSGLFKYYVILDELTIRECGMSMRFWQHYFPTSEKTLWLQDVIGECLTRHSYYVRSLSINDEGVMTFESGYN